MICTQYYILSRLTLLREFYPLPQAWCTINMVTWNTWLSYLDSLSSLLTVDMMCSGDGRVMFVSLRDGC